MAFSLSFRYLDVFLLNNLSKFSVYLIALKSYCASRNLNHVHGTRDEQHMSWNKLSTIYTRDYFFDNFAALKMSGRYKNTDPRSRVVVGLLSWSPHYCFTPVAARAAIQRCLFFPSIFSRIYNCPRLLIARALSTRNKNDTQRIDRQAGTQEACQR